MLDCDSVTLATLKTMAIAALRAASGAGFAVDAEILIPFAVPSGTPAPDLQNASTAVSVHSGAVRSAGATRRGILRVGLNANEEPTVTVEAYAATSA